MFERVTEHGFVAQDPYGHYLGTYSTKLAAATREVMFLTQDLRAVLAADAIIPQLATHVAAKVYGA